MNIVKRSISHLNPGQTPVVTLDQPLFALAKEIQWKYPETHGEDKCVVMFGGLHIEQAFLKVLGDWLYGSGWTAALEEGKVATSGIADSFLKASHIVRTRRAHQVTACCLFNLLQNSYAMYKEGLEIQECPLNFDLWRDQQRTKVPQFQYWDTALNLELLLLSFVKSLREANFDLYVSTVQQMLPWFFASSHPNYARWLSVHFRDMLALKDTAPDVAAAFQKGLFTVNKSVKKFSAIAIDHAHEQNNAIVKGEGGAVGLTENPEALRRWMLSGPEIARLVNEFMDVKAAHLDTPGSSLHHEAERSYQLSFFKDVKTLIEVFEEFGNPFSETSQDLFVLDTKIVAEEASVNRMQAMESNGKQQFKEFVLERLVKRDVPLDKPISKNKLDFFSTVSEKKLSRKDKQLCSIKKDCALFATLFIACQTRDGDLDEFFKFENQAYPPSLADQGDLRLPSKKAELTECLEELIEPAHQMTDVEAAIIDGAAIVNIIKPTPTQRTFKDYAFGSFLPYVETQLSRVSRIDFVWDDYRDNSLKATARTKRGTGVRQHVQANVKLPKNWKEFLRDDNNKKELFAFLAGCLESMDSQKQVITTIGPLVKSNSPVTNLASVAPCTHEEADTRMLLHAAHALDCGLKNIMLRTVDTDVLVLAVFTVQMLKDRGSPPFQLWVSFGTGKNHRNIPAHIISSCLGPEKSRCLPAFHALTGCDTVSSFLGRGKKTAMATWKSLPEVTQAFQVLTSNPTEVNQQLMRTLERFTVLLYDRTSNKTSVDEARKQLFVQKGRHFENIPPTSAALKEHIRRTAYQAGHVWGNTLVACPELPSPQDWGWLFDDGVWRPFWTSKPEIAKSCQELISCRCKKKCVGRCSCRKNDLRCTELCQCSEDCDRR